MTRQLYVVLAAAFLATHGVGQESSKPEAAPEALSLFGEPLYPLAITADAANDREAKLAEARARYDKDKKDLDAIVWLGRRTAYMGRFRESIALYTEGLTTHPDDPKLLRHRGHRYINLRDFDRAVADLARAAEKVAGRKDEPEPPGTPNARGVILDTLKQSIYYHLGLAHYLKGDFEKALSAYELCRRYSDNPDALASVSHWLYMTLRRLGRAEDASKVLEPVRADADIIENYGYHQLLLVYKGEKDGEKLLAETLASKKGGSDAASIGYGIGNWHFVQGRKARAIEVWKTTAALETWPAFGRIAAEVELKRLGVTLK